MVAINGAIKGAMFCFMTWISETDCWRHSFERKDNEKLPVIMLIRGDMKMPIVQYGMRISQKSWLNNLKLGRPARDKSDFSGTSQFLPWYTSPRCGILIRTALKTTLKVAEFSKRTWRLKKVRSCNWQPHSRSIRSVDKSRRIKLCRGPRTPVKNATNTDAKNGTKSREPKEPSTRGIVEQVVVKKIL